MATRERRARRFQVEALEGRWALTGLQGATIGTAMIRLSGEQIPQASVVDGAKLGIASGSNAVDPSVPDGSNSIRAGQEGN
jgi:hypothetical protein